jgi:hypothetical protein
VFGRQLINSQKRCFNNVLPVAIWHVNAGWLAPTETLNSLSYSRNSGDLGDQVPHTDARTLLTYRNDNILSVTYTTFGRNVMTFNGLHGFICYTTLHS